MKMILLSGLAMGQTTLPMTRMAKHATVGARACLVHKLPTRLVASRLVGVAPGVARSLGANPYKPNLCTHMALVVAAGFTFNEIARCDNQANYDLRGAIARYDIVGIVRAVVNGGQELSNEDLRVIENRLDVMLGRISYNDGLEILTLVLNFIDSNSAELENMDSGRKKVLLFGLRLIEWLLKEITQGGDELCLQQVESECGLGSVEEMKRLHLRVQRLLVVIKGKSSWADRISSNLMFKMMSWSSRVKCLGMKTKRTF